MKSKMNYPRVRKALLMVGQVMSRYWLILILLVMVAVHLILFSAIPLNTKSEKVYIGIAKANISKIVLRTYPDQVPLWFFAFKAYLSIFGDSLFAIRTFPLIFVLIAAFFVDRLAVIYGVNRYIATALFLFNPLMLSRIAFYPRHWSALVLMSLFTLYCFERLRHKKSNRFVIYMTLVFFMGFLSNLLYLLFFGLFSLYMLCEVIRGKVSARPLLSLAALVVGSITAFYLLRRYPLHHVLFVGNAEGLGRYDIIEQHFDLLREFAFILTGARYLPATFGWLLLTIILFLAISSFACPMGRKVLRGWLILTVIGSAFFIMVMRDHTTVGWRYLGFTVPLFYLAILPDRRSGILIFLQLAVLVLTVSSSINMVPDCSRERLFFQNYGIFCLDALPPCKLYEMLFSSRGIFCIR